MTKITNIFAPFYKLITIALLLVIVFSCTKKEPIKEVISIEELLGENSVAEPLEEETIEVPELDGTFVSKLNQKLYESFSFSVHDESTLIDRFSFNNREKSYLKSLTDSTITAKFFKYDFSDTSSTYNAFNNWLSCFGSKCEEVKLNDNKSGVQESPLWCGVFENSIVIIKFSDSALSQKNQLKQAIFQSVGLPLKYTLNVTADNELRWD